MARALIRSITAACLALLPLTALAQAYPVKPVRIVTQFVPGSSGDTALRIVTLYEPEDALWGSDYKTRKVRK